MPKHGQIPDRWLNYKPIGKRIEGTRFIAFKVPLKKRFCEDVESSLKLYPEKLLNYVPNLGLIIDLTNTSKYYDSEFFLDNGVKYVKLSCPGKEVPSSDTRHQFNRHVRKYLDENPDNGKLIGVHCTHGINRTGFLICSYMVTELNIEPLKAIKYFNMARGHSIERNNYLNMIKLLKMTAKRSRKDSWGSRSKASYSSGDNYSKKERKYQSPRVSSRESTKRRSSDDVGNWKKIRKISRERNESVHSVESRKWDHSRNSKGSPPRNNNYNYNNRHNGEYSKDDRDRQSSKDFRKEYRGNGEYNDKAQYHHHHQDRSEYRNNRFEFNNGRNQYQSNTKPNFVPRNVYKREEQPNRDYDRRRDNDYVNPRNFDRDYHKNNQTNERRRQYDSFDRKPNPFKMNARNDDRNKSYYPQKYERPQQQDRRNDWNRNGSKPFNSSNNSVPHWRSDRKDRDTSQNYNKHYNRVDRRPDESRNTREVGKSFAEVVKSSRPPAKWDSSYRDNRNYDYRRN